MYLPPPFPTIIQDIEKRVSRIHCFQGGALGLEVRESEADTRSHRTEQRFRSTEDKGENFFLETGQQM